MDKHSNDSNVSRFLAQVTEQISYKPLRPSIRQELENHVADRIEDYEASGIPHDDAEQRAIQDMGDAVIIGTELNAAHQLRRAPALAVISTLLLLMGFAFAAYLRWSPEQHANGFLYYIPGIALLLVTALAGYPLLVRHWKTLAVLTVLLYLAQIALSLYTSLSYNYIFSSFSYAAYYVTLFLAPVTTIAVYRSGSHPKEALLTALCCIGGWIMLSPGLMFANRTATAILFLTTLGTGCFMIHRNIFPEKKPRLYGSFLVCLTIIGCALLASSGIYTIQAFIAPQTVVTDTWDDSYNGVLIQELLGRTPLTHGLELSPEELMKYGNGSWYFTEPDSEHLRTYLLGDYDETNVTLWNVLPQHYHNNYLIALSIFLFGWLPGLAMIGVILLFYVLLFTCITRIHGKLASSVAFSCGLCLLWQSIFYLLGNFGYQYSAFPNLPLISEGRLSILFNMLLLGLIFSAYRFDCVVKEPNDFKPSAAA